MNSLINTYFQNKENYENKFYPPASEANIIAIEKKLKLIFPVDYKSFLLTTNGFEGFIGESYARFEQVKGIIEMIEGYELPNWVVPIGSNGAGEMYIIDRREDKYIFGILPFLFDDNDFIALGITFKQFIKRLFEGTLFDRT